MDGQRRADGPLRGVLQGDGRPEEPHDPVAGHLVDGPFEVMNLVDEDLEDPVHKAVRLFGAELLGERCIPGQVAEQHRDLSTLTLDPVPLGQDLLGQTCGEVTLQLGDGVKGRRDLGGGAGADKGWPHSLQNLLSGGFTFVQLGQASSRRPPQSLQNLAPSGLSNRHLGHCIWPTPERVG